MLKTHGRYPYSPINARPDFAWPGGKRLAVYAAINLEVFPYGEGMGPELSPKQPEPDIPNFTWRDWGNRVGIWRLLELFDEFKLPAAALMNTEIYEHCPQIAAAMRVRGDEFIGHGRSNAERQAAMSEVEEKALIEQVRDVFLQREGRAPAGWMGPWVNETWLTPDLLTEAGYSYVMDWAHDDQPVWLATRSGKKLLAIPYARPTNDLPVMHGAKTPPALWADMMIDQFDEMLRLSAQRPLIYNFSLHPYLSGHPFRMVHLRRVVAHIAARMDQVWWTTPGAIAAHCAQLPPGTIA
jgi:allantoinase